ncbi:MAG TPA: PDDEXK nuclease domain-containing protein [bacterium]|nr:PDDEXK nuclease domain-containing protein [bacterium]
MAGNEVLKNSSYVEWIKEIKEKVRRAQLKAVVAVNSAVLEFYWELGADIIEKQKSAKWGSGFLTQMSRDLMSEFPDVKGFSEPNLRFVKRWYDFYNITKINSVTACDQIAKIQEKLLFQIPWGHNRIIVTKCKAIDEAFFYVQKTIENNWSRTILTHQIESGLFKREGKAISNFSKTLPSPSSNLVQEMIKDPYNFDFVTLSKSFSEKELEQSLTDQITKFLLELGSGFAYIGKQVPIKVGEREFFIDLLFYHTKLHCYFVVELKTVEFEPEHAGKLNFYIKAVDMLIRKDGDNPTIGILLCKNKDKLVAEYSLSDINKPIGVSEYKLTQQLPESLKNELPSIKEIESKLSRKKQNAPQTNSSK